MNEGSAHGFRCGQIEDMLFLLKYTKENNLPPEHLIESMHKLNRDPELINLLNCIDPNIIEPFINKLQKKS